MNYTFTFLDTLGVAQYRLNQFDEALRTFDKSRQITPLHGTTLLFVAMCHHRLGDRERARLCYDDALQWAETGDAYWTDEFEARRKEAAQLLGLSRTPVSRRQQDAKQ